MKKDVSYTFSVCYCLGGYKTHEEEGDFSSRDEAYKHFRKLLNKFNVDGQSYYLCRWFETSRKAEVEKAISEDDGV